MVGFLFSFFPLFFLKKFLRRFFPKTSSQINVFFFGTKHGKFSPQKALILSKK
jgi:hypothetical protein